MKQLAEVMSIMQDGGWRTLRELLRHFQVFLSLGFDNEDAVIGQLDKKVRVVIGDVAVRVNVIQLEMHRQIILGL